MFDLISSLNSDKWVEVKVEDKIAENFTDYHVMKNHKQAPDCNTSMVYCIAVEDGNAKTVAIKDCKSKEDPLKQIGSVELQLNEDESEIIGIDLDGDIVVRI